MLVDEIENTKMKRSVGMMLLINFRLVSPQNLGKSYQQMQIPCLVLIDFNGVIQFRNVKNNFNDGKFIIRFNSTNYETID